MRILLTRPEVDAARTAATLRARGHAVVLAPLLAIEALPDADFGGGPWAAVLVTSANAARAIARHPRREELQRLPMFAVGAHSAQAMREAGFAAVTSADGDVAALARQVALAVEPGATLLYLAGAERSGDLAGALRAHNLIVHTAVIYRAVAATDFAPHTLAEIAAGIDAVLHFSLRSAATYIGIADKAGLCEMALVRPAHYCMAAQIAAPLLAAGATKVHVAAHPDEAALLALCG